MAKLMQDAIKMPSSFIVLLFQFHKNASYLVTLACFIYNMKFSKRYFEVNLDGCLEMWCGSLGGCHMTNDGGDHKLCQLLKLNQTKIGQGFEQTWHGPHGRQNVLHYVKVHKLPTTLLQLRWCEKLPSVDTCDCGLHRNLMFGINLIKELFIAT